MSTGKSCTFSGAVKNCHISSWVTLLGLGRVGGMVKKGGVLGRPVEFHRKSRWQAPGPFTYTLPTHITQSLLFAGGCG